MSGTYDVKRDLLSAFRTLIAPFVRILLRQGVSAREFSQVLKEVFVVEAAKELARPGKRVSLAKLAITTGLTRREVSLIVSDEELRRRTRETNVADMARVLEVWHSEANYQGPYGFPRDLQVDGDDPAGTFERLVKQYAPGVDYRLMLDDLVRVGVARLVNNDRSVRALSRTYLAKDMTPETIQVFTQAVRRYMETVDFNLSNRGSGERRFERIVYPDPGLREEDIPAFQQEMREYLESVIAEIDFRSTSYARPEIAFGEEAVRVGVGLYFYRDDPEIKPDLTKLVVGMDEASDESE